MKELMRLYVLITGFPVYALLLRPKIYYEDEEHKENKKIKGAALLVLNHYSWIDYLFPMFRYFGRKVYAVMLEGVFKISAFLRFFVSVIGGIRADRDIKGMRFMDEAVKQLERGKLVAIFPEAHCTTDGNIHDFKPSYILIALRANVPIVPIAVDGNYKIGRGAHALIGKSIRLSDYCTSKDPSREEIEMMNEAVRTKVVELKQLLDDKIAAERRNK